MSWMDVASVELPAGMQTADTLSVIDQIEMQVKAVHSKPPKKGDDGVPRVEALAVVVRRAFDRLLTRRDALRLVESLRQPAAPTATPVEESAADTKLDDAWKGYERVVSAGTKLTDGVAPGAAEAAKLHTEVFGSEGLKFTNIRPRRQWEASVARIELVNAPTAVATVEAIGGGRHLAALRTAHREFGLTFGFLKHTTPDAVVVTDTRAEQLAAQAALRDFVFRVSGQADEEDPASVALARFLLKPYTDLVDELARSARRGAKPTGGPANPIVTPR